MSAYESLSKRPDRLAKLFDIALVLITVFTAAELEIFTAISTEEELLRIFKMLTGPLTALIIFWLIKEIGKDLISQNVWMLLTEFCWNLWFVAISWYLVPLWYGPRLPVALQLTEYLSIMAMAFFMVMLIHRAYWTAYRSEEFYVSRKWKTYTS